MENPPLNLIDIHSHILCHKYLELLAVHGQGEYEVGRDVEGRTVVKRYGARFLTITPPMFDPAARLAVMDLAGVATQILSYTGPNCYWASGDATLEVVQVMNDHLAEVCATWPSRYRGLASIPLQNVELAIQEMTRALDQLHMVGIILLANVNGTLLDDARFEPLWATINERRVPVLLHPTIPPGAPAMRLDDYGLAAAVGFMFDSTLAVTRMVFAGIFERYRDWPMIVCHAGGTLPFLASRLDRCHETIPDARSRIHRRPSEYLARLYYDTACYDASVLTLACELAGAQHVLYGTDYPHNVSDVDGAAARIDLLSISEPEKDLIRSVNARRIFGLDR